MYSILLDEYHNFNDHVNRNIVTSIVKISLIIALKNEKKTLNSAFLSVWGNHDLL